MIDLNLLFSFIVFFSAPLPQPGQPVPPPPLAAAPQPKLEQPAPKVDAPPANAPKTDAEKLANGKDTIKQLTLAIEKINKRLEDPAGEYKKSETEFGTLNTRLKELKAMIAKLRKEGMTAEADKLEATLLKFQSEWELAKDRFDIAIRERKASQQSLLDLQERIATEQKMLDRLEGAKEPTEPKAAIDPEKKIEPAPMKPKPTPATAAPATKEAQPKADAPPAIDPITGLPSLPNTAANSTDTKSSQPLDAIERSLIPGEDDPAVRKARKAVEVQKAELQSAEARAQLAEQRVAGIEKSLATSRNILGLEQESIVQAERAATEFKKRLAADPAPKDAERADLNQKLVDSENRLAESKARWQRVTDRIATLSDTLRDLKAERDVAIAVREENEKQVAAAELELQEILSPTATLNLFRWVVEKGPRILLILVGMVSLHIAMRLFSRQIVRFITRHSERGSPEDRENRAHTLVGVFRYAAGLVVFGGGLVMVLDEVGLPIVPLMGGAAVIGLAVAFGAQNLIRDYFTGFMMLMEDQYSVNDVVRMGAIAGLVEQITLRVTVLRDLEGTRHFIPHGTIHSVSNLTHGWSRALMEIPVAYKENVDRVIDLLVKLGLEMRTDPVLGRHILEDPEMLGVDSLADSGVVIKFLLKTRPLYQWPIKRELLRRIKNRFDEVGIEIPFPHRTVYHHFPEGGSEATLLAPERGRPAA